MMEKQQPKAVYFVGIGGIGMSALARYYLSLGYFVAGYDKTPSELTEALRAQGIAITYNDEPENVPVYWSLERDKSAEPLVIYTPAIPAETRLLRYFFNNGFKTIKRAAALGVATQGQKTLAIAGTHGKTTTSTLLAHLLKVGGFNISAFLGGMSTNYNTNFIGDGHDFVVVEADEYDRSFLSLNPTMAVITSMDADHLDIYGADEALSETYRAFAQLVPANGKIWVREGLPIGDLPSTPQFYAGDASTFANNIRIENHVFVFDYSAPGIEIRNLQMGIPGYHNIENAVAAISVALACGVSAEDITKGIASFKGVKRRFELVFKQDEVVYVDDYAHHPTEIEAFLGSLKQLYPGKPVTAIFQPHLFSRTRDFATGFAKALSLADVLIIMPIYPARELPIPNVNAEMLLEMATSPVKMVLNHQEVIKWVEANEIGLLATIGAGDIDRLVQPISKILQKQTGGSI